MRASPLGQTLLLLSAVTALCLGLRDSQCPRSLDCARQGRSFCRHGDTRCGPCLQPLVENSRGRCLVRKRHTHRQQTQATPTQATPTIKQKEIDSFPDLDQEIDILSAVISEHRTNALTAPPIQEEPAPSGPAPTETWTNGSGPSPAPPTQTANHSSALLGALVQSRPLAHDDSVLIAVSSVFVVTGSVALMIAGACWVRLHRGARLSQKLDFAPSGLRRPQSFNSQLGDRRLVQSAQMFHYQHQRAQMLSLERQRDGPKVPDSGASTDDENEEDFTVYECPGLAPTGEMEVKNPLFDDSTLYFHRFHQ